MAARDRISEEWVGEIPTRESLFGIRLARLAISDSLSKNRLGRTATRERLSENWLGRVATRDSSSSDISCASFIDYILSLKLCLPFLKVFLKMDKPLTHIAKSLSLLEKQEEEYKSVIDKTSLLKNHILRLKLGFSFLGMFLNISQNEDLKLRIGRVVYDVRLQLHSISNEPVDGRLILDLDRVYSNLREKMKDVIIKPDTLEYDAIFPPGSVITSSRFKEISDFFWQISGDLSSTAHLSAPLAQEIEGIKEKLEFVHPLHAFLYEHKVDALPRSEELSTLVALIGTAAGLFLYVCLVNKMNEEMALAMKSMLSDLLEKTNVDQIYLGILRDTRPRRSSLCSLLRNLIWLFGNNPASCKPSDKLYEKLGFLYTEIDRLPCELRSANFSYLLSHIEALAKKSIPILCSCHFKDMEEDMAKEVNSALLEVLDQIEHIRQDGCKYIMSSDDHPKTNGLGFLDHFLGYIELLKCRPELNKPLLDKIQAEFEFLRSFLRKFKEIRNEHEELRDLWESIICLAYEAEFLIDLCLLKTSSYKSSLRSLVKVTEQTERISAKVERIDAEKKYHLQAHDVTRTSILVPSQAIDEETDEVVGFEEVEKEIMKQLVSDNKQLDFISIDGMPGAGKTTLAKKMYEAASIIKRFDVRVWCAVSQTYQIKEMLISILKDVNKVEKYGELAENPDENLEKAKDKKIAENLDQNLQLDENSRKVKDKELADDNSRKAKDEELAENPDENSRKATDEKEKLKKAKATDEEEKLKAAKEEELKLAEKLYKSLKGRRYLIIFDDMWDIDAWNKVQKSFPNDNNHSRILITTRFHNMASNIKAGSKVHTLRQLNDDDSWKLFEKTLKTKKKLSKDFEEVGKEIAKSCKGLPLAIVVIAGLLAKVKNVFEWEKIAQSLKPYILNISESPVMAILELGYKHLPDHLKSCFLYFGAFKEDEEIRVRKLKWLWITEGFVQNNESKSLDDVAEDYFNDLISRSLVIVSKERSLKGVKTCRIHDVLHEFCLVKAQEESFLQLPQVNHYSYYRRVIVPSEESEDDLKEAGGLGLIRVRSLLYNLVEFDWRLLRIDFICENFKLLTMLDLLNDSQIDEWDFKKILLLIHLRYLAIQVKTRSIPSSISNLWKLQCFIFHSTDDFSDRLGGVKVPDSLWDMVDLRVVCVQPRAYFCTEPKRLILNNSSLVDNLETLSTAFFCEKDSQSPFYSVSSGDVENFPDGSQNFGN